MKRFLAKGLCVLICVCAIILCLEYAYFYMVAPKVNGTENDEYKFFSMPSSITVANVGSSHGQCDFAYDDYPDISCFNFALTAQSIEYDERIMKQYISRMEDGSVLIIPVSYMSFFMSDYDFDEEYLKIKNSRYYLILKYKYIMNPDILQYIESKLLVFFFGDMRADVAAYVDRLFNPVTTNDSDYSTVTTNHAAAAEDAASAYERHVTNYSIEGTYPFKEDLIQCYYNIISMCRERNITPVLVTTPFLKEYNDLVDEEFLTQFHMVVDKITDDTGVRYYDYSGDERFQTEYELFMNSDHLNKDGAKYFTDIFFEEHILELIEDKK